MYFINYFYVSVTGAAPKCPNAGLAAPNWHRRLVPFRVSVTKLIGCRAAVRALELANCSVHYSSVQFGCCEHGFEVTGQVADMPGQRQATSPTRTFTSPTSQPADKSTRCQPSQVAEISSVKVWLI